MISKCKNYDKNDISCVQCALHQVEEHNSCYERIKTMENKENVNHPSHYQGKNECIVVMRAMFGDKAVMDFCRLNAFKYRFRAKAKNGDEDIKKAEWYETYLIDMLENSND